VWLGRNPVLHAQSQRQQNRSCSAKRGKLPMNSPPRSCKFRRPEFAQ
jgi:hypothetical protein